MKEKGATGKGKKAPGRPRAAKAAKGRQSPRALRQRAEEILRKTRAEVAEMSSEEVCNLVHELHVHQIELELQNEELREAQLALAESRDRYSDLFEFAPVGYLTLERDGTIEEANLTAATMLQVERKELIGMKLAKLIAPESQDHWYLYRRAVFAEQRALSCELEMRAADGTAWWARAESVVTGSGDDRRSRTALLDITEKREAEMALESLNLTRGRLLDERTGALHKSVARIKLLMEAIRNLGEGIVITTAEADWPDVKIVFVNEAMCRITGYRAEELIGQTRQFLNGEATDRDAVARVGATLSAGDSCLAELTVYRKDGTPYHAEIFITPLADDEGRRTNYVSIHRDITERKKAEEASRERQERLQAILTAAVDAVITIDREGIIVSVNPATERIFGYSESELLGQNVKILMPAPYREEHDGYLARFQETGEARIIGIGREVEGRRKDGSTFPVDLAVSEVEGLGLYTGIIRDITERKKAQMALQQEHEFSEKVIGTARTIILVLDREGRIVSFNPYLEELSGWRLAEVKGQDWFSTFIPERDRKRIGAVFKRAMAGKRTRGNVNAILTKRGTERIIEWFDAVLKDEAGDMTCLLCTGTDITERQLLEQEVINAAEVERETISRDLHDDLGSLLTGIKLQSEGLAAALAREGSGHAEKASAAARQVSDAIARTRGIARGLRPVGSDPEDLVGGLRALAERTGAVTDFQCRFDCPEPIPIDSPIRANHLYRIAQEAVNNAVKYSGGSQIVISFREIDGALELRIEDNGSGLDNLAKRGSGLGLHTMRYRANAMNGFLEIESGPAVGTNIVCTVPATAPK